MLNTEDIQKAARHLKDGGTVILPTDTVYGIAANAMDEMAVSKIYAAKGRRFDKPLIVFVKNLGEAENFAGLTPLAQRLAQAFLPGPLSLVLKKRGHQLAKNLTGDFDTIGIRIPDNVIVSALLAACPFPLAVTSANRSGEASPKTLRDVKIPADCILDGGDCALGVVSTVVDARGEMPKILRAGALSEAQIMKGAKA